MESVYTERARLVAALTRIFASHLCPASDAEPGFSHVVCVHGWAGQMAWHIADDDLHLFSHLLTQENHWDGHSTPEKYTRLDEAMRKYEEYA